MTYKQAHQIIMDHLADAGWSVKTHHNGRRMKIPHATTPSGRKRLYFKARAIHESFAPNLSLRDARTVSYDTPTIKEWAQAILLKNHRNR
tara:strand:- start:573 stop:842 length:270 start_codon:yes stop_codon:yes gene_type:complete